MKVFLYIAVFSLLTGCQPTLQRLSGTQAPDQATVLIDDLDIPTMRVKIPSRSATAQLSRIAVNNGVETWLAADNISLSFQQGILVATRGLGFDLMGASAQSTLNAIIGEKNEVYRRQMRYLSGENHSTYLMAGCSMTTVGTEIVRGRPRLRLEEKCLARMDKFTNIFWLNGSGKIVQSQQWVSPEIGYLLSNLAE